MGIPLISVGLFFVFVGIMSGSLQALNVELPVLRTTAHSIVLFEVGVTIAIIGFYVHYHDPPGPPAEITVTADSVTSYSGRCPADIIVTGSITVGTGKGDVGYHAALVTPYGAQINGRPLNVYFSAPGTQKISDTLHLVSSATPGKLTFFFQTQSPTRQASNKQALTVECTP